MRKLSMKQKRLIASVKQLTPTLMRSLEQENDYETLYQDAVRLFDDLQLYRKAQTKRIYSLETYLKNWR